VLAAWLVHLYTASGAVLAFLAVASVVERDYRTAFFFLSLQVVVDATDGMLARAVRVSERLPWFNGAKLDDIVDYLTFVFVPALIVWRAGLVPDVWSLPVASLLLVSSAYGFNRDDAKTADHFFTGFPSYWNIVVFYLMAGAFSAVTNLVLLVVFGALVFVPIRYIYPSRTPVWRLPMNLLGVLWGVAMLAMLWQFPDVSRGLFWVSLAYPVLYGVLSLVLHLRPRREAGWSG
jgi:phosphatidylcholine synthase